MKILKWMMKHKLLAYWIVTFTVASFGIAIFSWDAFGIGRLIGLFFIPYWFIVWSASKNKGEDTVEKA